MSTGARLSPLSVATWHKNLSSPDQRDKLCRLLQYLLKLLHALDGPSASGPRATEALESTVGSARQLARVCKWVSVYATTSASASQLRALPLRQGADAHAVQTLAAAVNDAGLFGYYAADNAALVAKLGLIPSWKARAPRFARFAASCWLVGLVGALCGELARLRGLQAETLRQRRARSRRVGDAKDGADDGEQRAECEQEERVLERETSLKLRAARVKIVRLAADAVVAFSIARPGTVGAGVVGAAGSLGSALSLYLGWPRAM